MHVYEVSRLSKLLAENSYPGCGIALGISPDGCKAVAIYFIMGRSFNSRNRMFVQEPDGIRIQPYDPKRVRDPHLILYHPVRETAEGLIVTNGDQTDTIAAYLSRGESLEAALRTRCFEDDGPNWTPRISGIQAKDGSYKLSVLKASDVYGTGCVRAFYEYPAVPGLGHFVHTYERDNTLGMASFRGEPERVTIGKDIETFTDILWDQLNPDHRIALFVRYTDLKTGEYQQRILNKLA